MMRQASKLHFFPFLSISFHFLLIPFYSPPFPSIAFDFSFIFSQSHPFTLHNNNANSYLIKGFSKSILSATFVKLFFNALVCASFHRGVSLSSNGTGSIILSNTVNACALFKYSLGKKFPCVHLNKCKRHDCKISFFNVGSD